jgi:DNA-binding transcriptional LysR family regulator
MPTSDGPHQDDANLAELDFYCRNLLIQAVTFDLIERLGGIDRAANALCMNSAKINARLHALQRALGNELVLETGKRIKRHTTPLGKRYLKLTAAVIPPLQEFILYLRGEQTTRDVHVVTINSAWFAYKDELTSEFAKHAKGAAIVPHYLPNASDVPEAIANGEYAAGIVSYLSRVRKPLYLHPWRTEKMVLAVSIRNKHFINVRKVETKDLEAVRFIRFMPDMPIGIAIQKHLELMDITLKNPKTHDNISTIINAVAADDGISILPEPCLRRNHDVKHYSLPRPLDRQLSVLFHQDAFKKPLMCAFLACFGIARAAKLAANKKQPLLSK